MKKSGQPAIAASDWEGLDNYKKHVDASTRFIPGWVKVSVAMALGLGTMIGWKRIVVTVGEKIGKEQNQFYLLGYTPPESTARKPRRR